MKKTTNTITGAQTASKGASCCFVAGTPILLASGEEVAIDTLVEKTDSIVACPEGVFNRIARPSVRENDNSVYRIITADGRALTVTEFHPMLVKSPSGYRIIPANILRKGQLLRCASGFDRKEDYVAIKRIEVIPHRGNVYNVALVGQDLVSRHLLIANGIITGDLVLQATMVRRFAIQAFAHRRGTEATSSISIH